MEKFSANYLVTKAWKPSRVEDDQKESQRMNPSSFVGPETPKACRMKNQENGLEMCERFESCSAHEAMVPHLHTLTPTWAERLRNPRSCPSQIYFPSHIWGNSYLENFDIAVVRVLLQSAPQISSRNGKTDDGFLSLSALWNYLRPSREMMCQPIPANPTIYTPIVRFFP